MQGTMVELKVSTIASKIFSQILFRVMSYYMGEISVILS